jgi:hypothetical protein
MEPVKHNELLGPVEDDFCLKWIIPALRAGIIYPTSLAGPRLRR